MKNPETSSEIDESQITSGPDVSINDETPVKDMPLEDQVKHLQEELGTARQAYTELSQALLQLSQELQEIAQHYSSFTQGIQNQLLELSVRRSVIEFIFTKEECAAERQALANGEALTLDQMRKIAEEQVIPEFQERQAEMEEQQKAQREHQERVERAQESSDEKPQIILPEGLDD